MPNFIKQSALFFTALFLFTGCATTGQYKPMGLTDREFTMKQNDLLAVCQHMRMGTYVTVKFYDDAVDAAKQPLKGSRTGYFYVYDKMMGTLSLSNKPLSFSDRGEAYPLAAIESVSPAQEAAGAKLSYSRKHYRFDCSAAEPCFPG